MRPVDRAPPPRHGQFGDMGVGWFVLRRRACRKSFSNSTGGLQPIAGRAGDGVQRGQGLFAGAFSLRFSGLRPPSVLCAAEFGAGA